MKILRKLFERHLEEWKKHKPKKEFQRLLGGLMYYGSMVPANPNDKLWNILEKQLNFQAEKHNTTPEEFVNFLFTSETHDIFIARLQI